jgi:hypothetical protein
MPTVKNVGHAPKSNTTRGNVRPMHDKNLSSVAHEVPSTNHNHQILFFFLFLFFKTERSTRKAITQTQMKEEWLFWAVDDEDGARLKVVFFRHSKARKKSRAIAFALYNYCGDH